MLLLQHNIPICRQQIMGLLSHTAIPEIFSRSNHHDDTGVGEQIHVCPFRKTFFVPLNAVVAVKMFSIEVHAIQIGPIAVGCVPPGAKVIESTLGLVSRHSVKGGKRPAIYFGEGVPT